MISSAYNSFVAFMPSREEVKTAFHDGCHELSSRASDAKNFLYNVLFVDLQKMEESQAAEYRTYKIAAAVILAVGALALGAGALYLGVKSWMALAALPRFVSVFTVFKVVLAAELGTFGSIAVPVFGCVASASYVEEIRNYDQSLEVSESMQLEDDVERD